MITYLINYFIPRTKVFDVNSEKPNEMYEMEDAFILYSGIPIILICLAFE